MNASNRIPLSVRISQEDADFIAGLNLEGANTPSEKIREILKQARLMNAQQRDYGAALNQAEQFFQTAKHEVLHAEKQLGVHSPILARMFELLPDLSATLASDLPEEADLDSLKKYEQEIMRRVVRLADSILQLAVTGRGAAYDDAVLAELENTLRLARIVWQRYEDEAV
ncbi:MAG: hypothetical protein Q4D78_05825 [Neisseria zoodegmatis]|uniref:hypothetical protein n=1 Tax=Neisseria zoodegmatis TaxID=326523 RepID=UPI0026F0BECF|nr:hypothetical protein [Neisseria zoodegmatis]MDO5069706.1 hypothetical protein [Neisseria zoodegmatis]